MQFATLQLFEKTVSRGTKNNFYLLYVVSRIFCVFAFLKIRHPKKRLWKQISRWLRLPLSLRSDGRTEAMRKANPSLSGLTCWAMFSVYPLYKGKREFFTLSLNSFFLWVIENHTFKIISQGWRIFFLHGVEKNAEIVGNTK